MEKILVVEEISPFRKHCGRLCFESEMPWKRQKPNGELVWKRFHSSPPCAGCFSISRLPGLAAIRLFCREINKRLPLLRSLSSLALKTDVATRFLLLELGADDYVTIHQSAGASGSC